MRVFRVQAGLGRVLVRSCRLVRASLSGGSAVQGVLELLIRRRQRVVVAGVLVLLGCPGGRFFNGTSGRFLQIKAGSRETLESTGTERTFYRHRC